MLTFPLLMPDQLRVLKPLMKLTPLVQSSPSRTRGGSTYATELGPAIWTGSWESGPLREDEIGVVRGWLDALGGTNPFWGYDHTRPRPLAYVRGWPGGTARQGILQSVASGCVLTIGGLFAGMALTPGDYLAFDYGAAGSRALHRVVAAAVADGAGVVSVEVRPHARLGWGAGTAVYFERAAARMIVLPDTIKDTPPAKTYGGKIAFEAVQSI